VTPVLDRQPCSRHTARPVVTNVRSSECDSNGRDRDKSQLLNGDFKKKCAQCVDSKLMSVHRAAGIVSSDTILSDELTGDVRVKTHGRRGRSYHGAQAARAIIHSLDI